MFKIINVPLSIQKLIASSRESEGSLDFDEDDQGNPRNFSTRKKILIASYALLCAFTATLSAPIYIASIPGVTIAFDLSTTLAILPVSLYAFGIGIGALISTACAEVLGRTILYRTMLPIALAFTIVGGAAKNFATLAVTRVLAGLFASPGVTIGVGVLNDLWNTSLEKTGTLFAVNFVMFIIWATQIGPMMGAAIVQDRDWRWTFWLNAIFLGITSVAAFFIPETYKPEILRKRAKKLNMSLPNRNGFSSFIIAIGRPLHMLIIEPVIFPASLVVAIFQACLFCFYIAYALVFMEIYNFTNYQIGMSFAPLLVGSVLAVPVIGVFDKMTYQKARENAIQSGGSVPPEERLYPTMLGSALFPIAIFWFAWTSRPEIHWIAPIMSGLLFGLAYVLVMLCLPIYINDIYGTHYGASALAANAFIRFLISAPFPLFTVQMIHNLGIGWGISLIAFIALAMLPIPLVFYRWGPALRNKSVYLAQQ